jgi:hypothetical protein
MLITPFRPIDDLVQYPSLPEELYNKQAVQTNTLKPDVISQINQKVI